MTRTIYVVIGALALVTLPLSAQAANKTYTLKLSGAEVNVIGQALGEMPFKLVNPVITKIIGQIRSQEASQAPQNAKTGKKQ